MHSTRTRTAAGLLGALAFCLAVPTTTFADPGTDTDTNREPTAYCGTDKASGLAVWAAEKGSCATALQVASAYTEVWQGSTGASVRAAGTTWKCRERQGDPNPYQECVSTSDSGRWVRLSS
ncbi:hypothetical protein GT045_17360 [Streptomyces sp. SID486]|uniref:hypothetical protein n=1 Tax=Streptomyces sp. SID486 TaxID=2690264 RepID=UPI00136F6E4C|nr:hypothetical protein [Streptomyces sp. SID486]